LPVGVLHGDVEAVGSAGAEGAHTLDDHASLEGRGERLVDSSDDGAANGGSAEVCRCTGSGRGDEDGDRRDRPGRGHREPAHQKASPSPNATASGW
jgi:hypothetical protein